MRLKKKKREARVRDFQNNDRKNSFRTFKKNIYVLFYTLYWPKNAIM